MRPRAGDIAAVLEFHGIRLPEPELEAARDLVEANMGLWRSLVERDELIPANIPPALGPVWAPSPEAAAPAPVQPPAADGETGARATPGAAATSGTAASSAAAAGVPYPRCCDSPSEAVETALARIQAHPDANVFTAVFAEQAREEAKALEGQVGQGAASRVGRDELPLWGTAVSIKDLMRIKGYRMTGGTKAITFPVAAEDAVIVQRLRRAGAVIIGATNLHELAFGTTGVNPHFGTPANPAAPGHLPGGSSSGSAASVGFGMATFSIGTDTGGSIRIPAACCGIVGFKPSFGLLPTEGVFPLGFSLDHVGPLTRTVTEAAVLMDVLAGQPGRYTSGIEQVMLKGLRIGVPRNYFTLAQPEVRKAYEDTLDAARVAGAELVSVSLPLLEMAPAAYLCTSGVEAVAIHYHTLVRNGDKLGRDVRIRLSANVFIPAYARIRAQQLRTLLFQQLSEVFRTVDVLAVPTLPIVPPPVGQNTVQLGDVKAATTLVLWPVYP